MLTLGPMIRAARLGWHMTPRGYLLRVSAADDGRWRLDFHPPSLVPGRDKVGAYRVWWEGGGRSITEFPPVRYIRTVTRPFTLYVDDHGKAA